MTRQIDWEAAWDGIVIVICERDILPDPIDSMRHIIPIAPPEKAMSWVISDRLIAEMNPDTGICHRVTEPREIEKLRHD